jgi:hypothetical protein
MRPALQLDLPSAQETEMKVDEKLCHITAASRDESRNPCIFCENANKYV